MGAQFTFYMDDFRWRGIPAADMLSASCGRDVKMTGKRLLSLKEL